MVPRLVLALLTATMAAPGVAAGVRAPARVLITSGQDVVRSASGATTLRLPREVVSGAVVTVTVTTTPTARVVLSLTFSNGESIRRHRRADARGRAVFSPRVAYQPAGSADTIAVGVRVNGPGVHDTIAASIGLLRHLALGGSIDVPARVHEGRLLHIRVHADEPGVSVALQLVYPDGAIEAAGSGLTDAAGSWTTAVPMPAGDGHGLVRVIARLASGGTQRRVQATTRLVGPR